MARKKASSPKRSSSSTRRARSDGGKKKAKVKFPLHALEAALRIPKVILEQNAGKKCTDAQAARFVGLASPLGAFSVELSSAIKYRLLERPESQTVELTDLGRKILKPQTTEDEREGRREAIIDAPVLGDVYKHYRGENVPDTRFFRNALVDTFGIPSDRLDDFETIFIENLRYASLLSEDGDKRRVLDVSESIGTASDEEGALKTKSKSSGVKAGDTCFVMQPFNPPLGDYYQKVFVPAIEKAGLKAVRADDDMFATGKIVEQIWRGINAAKVLVAELSTRNPNVFYELGLAHALDKPVVLVSSNEQDVPFDLRHIRVIYYDTTDPFWGKKLIDKIAENVVSALQNPQEALFKKLLS